MKQHTLIQNRCRWIGVGALFAMLLSGGGLWAAPTSEPAATNGPRLVCEAPVFDYGRVVNTQEVAHSFVLRNAGDAPVEIGRIHSGCSCTRSQASATTIPPGGTATVDVVFHLRGRKGERIINIFVNSNDKVNPIYQLRCRGETYFSEEDRVVGSESLSATGGSGPEGRKTTDRVRAGQAAESDRPAVPGQPEAIQPGITVIPAEVVLVESSAGRIPARYVMVRATGQQPFQIVSVESDGGNEPLATIHQTGKGWATLRVGPLTARPEWKTATIQLITDLKGFETIPIRVTLQP